MKPIERIDLTRDDFFKIEHQIRLQEHLRRYAAVRRFVYGKVLDFASGCGYGTFLLSASPEVDQVIGIDKDEESISWAKENYSSEKCEFHCMDVRQFEGRIDTLVSLETIEHFEDNTIYTDICKKLQIDQLILSYPNKKSTHFNPFHVRDLNKQSACDAFQNYVLIHTFSMGDVDCLIFLRRPERMPSHIYGNIADFR